MTIVNRNTYAHSGLLVTGTGDEVRVELEIIGGRTVRMSTEGDELGTWPVDDCHIEPDPLRPGRFRLQVDGDDAFFTPSNLAAFAPFVAVVADTETPFDGLSTPWTVDPPSVEPPMDEPQSQPDSPTDDPVAFLFGSPAARSPVPSAEPAADVTRVAEAPSPPELGQDDTDQLDSAGPSVVEVEDFPLEDAAPVDPAPTTGLEPPDDEGGWIDLDVEVEVGAVIDPDGSAPDSPSDVPVDFAGDSGESGLDDLFLLEPEDDVLGSGVDAPTTDTDLADDEVATSDAAALRSRFGSSALDRLSGAIESVTAARSAGEESYEIGPNTVADEVLTSQRTLREARQKSVARKGQLRLTLLIGGALTVVVFLVLATPRVIDFVSTYEGGPELPPPLEVTATTLPVDQLPVAGGDSEPEGPSTPPTEDTIFDRPAPEFVARWDSYGGPISAALEFDAYPRLGPFHERFTPFLTMEGVVQPDGTLDGFALVIDPSGPAEYDRVALQALGVAVATVDPERSPDGRAALLAQLGLNVRQPMLQGIDGTVVANGVRYSLVYDDEALLLTLSVAPAD